MSAIGAIAMASRPTPPLGVRPNEPPDTASDGHTNLPRLQTFGHSVVVANLTSMGTLMTNNLETKIIADMQMDLLGASFSSGAAIFIIGCLSFAVLPFTYALCLTIAVMVVLYALTVSRGISYSSILYQRKLALHDHSVLVLLVNSIPSGSIDFDKASLETTEEFLKLEEPRQSIQDKLPQIVSYIALQCAAVAIAAVAGLALSDLITEAAMLAESYILSVVG